MTAARPEGRTAGRKLDAEIAERVMGYVWRRSNMSGRRCLYAPDTWPSWMDTAADGTEPVVLDWHDGAAYVPPYSTDIAAAWLVVERMEAMGYDGMVRRVADGYAARFDSAHRFFPASVDPREGNAALAICRAALSALSSRPAAPEGRPE